MAPNRGRNRQHEFVDLAQTGAKDFDPEEEQIPNGSHDHSGADDSDQELDGREHYISVGKSKLREPKSVALGPQYGGSRVTRDALETEDEDEPFSRGLVDDSGSSSSDFRLQGGQEGESNEDDDELHYGSEATDLSDGGNIATKPGKISTPVEQENLMQVITDARNAVVKTLSQATKEEAQKGHAVKRQRTAFDSLLNTRIKLQKSLIATNTLAGTAATQLEAERKDVQQALEAAESAAFKLWSSLNALRDDLSATQGGKKRKRSELSVQSPTGEFWAHVQAQDLETQPLRNAVLDKWSNKAQGPSLGNERLNQTKRDTMSMVLQEQLADSSRLLARAHAPRSCAPLQLSQRLSEDQKIYDDADFYGLLLKELLEQKSQDSVAASNIDLGLQMQREAKTKRNVDTKASKGRKLRYTVHEKLQNFMAPEDRTKWGGRQADELFGSLFGQRLGLAERDEDAEVDDEIDGINAEEPGLFMFRS